MRTFRFIPSVEQLERRLLLAGLAPNPALEIAGHDHGAVPAQESETADASSSRLNITCRTECVDSNWELVVQVSNSGSLRDVAIAGSEPAAMNENGIARLPIGTDARLLVITVTDDFGRQIPVLEVRLGQSNDVIAQIQITDKPSGEASDVPQTDGSHHAGSDPLDVSTHSFEPESEASGQVATSHDSHSMSSGSIDTTSSSHHSGNAGANSSMAQHTLLALRMGMSQNSTDQDSADETPHSGGELSDEYHGMEADSMVSAQEEPWFPDSLGVDVDFNEADIDAVIEDLAATDGMLLAGNWGITTSAAPLAVTVKSAGNEPLANQDHGRFDNLSQDRIEDSTSENGNSSNWEISYAIAIAVASAGGACLVERRRWAKGRHV